MTMGLVGRKCGMTRIFTPEGVSIPVSVIEVTPNRITQLKSPATDGYSAVQVTFGERRASRVTQPMSGHYKKAGVAPGRGLVEFRVEEETLEQFGLGQDLNVDRFSDDQMVDIIGITRGRGFTGTIKRWNFAGQRNSHGNSLSHRMPGSIGQNQTPGKVFKGKKMSGHYGNEQVTIQNLLVVRVDVARNLLLVKGAVPGAPGGLIIIKPAVKQATKASTAA